MDIEHPEVQRAEQHIVATAREHNKAVGTIATTPELFRKTVAQGFAFILTASLTNLACLGARTFRKDA